MKRTSSFEHFAEYTRKVILEAKIIQDVLLMVKLNFTPPNWKIWKPKLIEYFSIYEFNMQNKDSDKEIKYSILYNKKEKTWKVNYIND